MYKNLKVISWNIAGGHTIASLDHFDYGAENLPYFAETIRAFEPDVVCLQEIHVNQSRNIAAEIADLIKLKHIYTVASSLSHIDPTYQLGLGVLSKHPFYRTDSVQLPYPSFELIFNNGKKAKRFNKHIQIVKLEQVNIINTFFQPLGLWRYTYTKGKGRQYAKEIERLLLKIDIPFILCGDLGIDKPLHVFRKFTKENKVTEAFTDILTRPVDEAIIKHHRIDQQFIVKQTDHILYSQGCKVRGATVKKTHTDHYLCYAQLQIDQ